MKRDVDDTAAQPVASGWIYPKAMEGLRRAYGETLASVRIERLVVGVFATGVKLSNGCGGLAFTSPEVIAWAGRHILNATTTSVHGMAAQAVVAGAPVGPFAPVIRLATLNALSVPVLDELAGLDDQADLEDFRPLVAGRKVCMVGAMVPLIERLLDFGAAAIVVADRKADTLAAVQPGVTIIAPEDLPGALAACETAIVTGATIPNDSLSGLLDAVSSEAAVAVVGPTAAFVPDPLFERGVALIGTTVVDDSDLALDILAEGGGIYHLFQSCLRKINLVNEARLHCLGLRRTVA